MSSVLEPHYAAPGLRERFAEIAQRPVVLEAAGLGKRFSEGGTQALLDINLQVRRREFITVIGPSGCGKSTLIRILAGLETASSGSLRLDGKPVSGPGPERGMVFQGYSLFPWKTVLGNVMFGPLLAGTLRHHAESEARQWLDLVGLGGKESFYPHQLSGGMQQRVAIARALANRPRVLLMDEPFGALDAQTRASLQAHLLQLWERINMTVLFITHDLDEAVFLADRIVVLDANPGRIREIVEVPVPRPRRLDQLHEPAFLDTRRYIEQLIHPTPTATPEVESLPNIPRLTPIGDEA